MKYSIKRMRRQATDWEKILAKYITGKALLSKIHKNSKNSRIPQFKNGQKI